MRRIFWLLLVSGAVSGIHLSGQSNIERQTHQSSMDSLFEVVLQNNRTLTAAAQMMDASKLGAGTGNTPPDPMVEVGWLSGFPESIGDRLDFSVSQEFEFPTTYIHLANAKEIRQEQAELVYNLTRQDVLWEAQKLMIERIHLNRLWTLLSRRMEQAGKLKEHYRRMLETGEIGKLSLSQVNLQLSVLKADIEQVQSEIRLNTGRIREVTGGQGFSITSEQFPVIEIPDRSALDEAYATGPRSAWYDRNISLKEKQKQVAVSKAFPDLSVGYYSESVINERFRGVSLGISVPLWSNKNKVKYAAKDISVAEAEKDRFRIEQQTELESNLEHRGRLLLQINELEQVLSEIDDEELLGIALELGEISLSEYIYSSEYYLQNVRRLMGYKRDLKLVESDIMKIYL